MIVASTGAPRDPAVRAVMLYKFAKSTLQLAGALSITACIKLGYGHAIAELCAMVRDHASAAWSHVLVDALMRFATPHYLQLLAYALALDGALGMFEGVALRQNYRWARTFVVLATSIPLPFELYELVRDPHAGRVVLLLVNLAVVALLVRAPKRTFGQ